jgi:hypothetical protein
VETKLLRNLLRPGCTYAPRRPPEPWLYSEASQGLEPLTGVSLYFVARAVRVAHVLCAVKLDFVSRVERFGNYLAMFEGEWGDYKKGRVGAYAVESVEYSRRPQRIWAVIEGQRGPWDSARCAPCGLDSPSTVVTFVNTFRP